MPRTPSRLTQWTCVAITVAATVPWSLLVIGLLNRAVASPQPLTMSVVAWLVMLVPMWVVFLGSVAWRKWNESDRPALMMALPPCAISALFMALPQVVAI